MTSAAVEELVHAEPVAGNYFVAAYPPFSFWSPDANLALLRRLDQPAAAAEPLGIYVHVPFCARKCDYCYYLSFTAQPASVIDEYVDTLVEEAALYRARRGISKRPVRFLYAGGGTPSLLSAAQVDTLCGGLRDSFHFAELEEFTFEVAPRSVRADLLEALKRSGVTRVSMGVQSFDDDLLRRNGRMHLRDDVLRACRELKAAGFGYVNLDLMAGLPGESAAQWESSVRKAIELNVESITLYLTEIPYNTRLFRNLREGRGADQIIDWEEKRRRLEYGFELLERAGYTLISGYTAVRDPQKQRFAYQDYLWSGTDMLPLGVAAFGYFQGFHFQNETELGLYSASVRDGSLPVKRAFELSREEQFTREFLLQLKLGGIDCEKFVRKFGIHPGHFFAGTLDALAQSGHLKVLPYEIELTRKGLLCVDRLLPLFYEARFQNARYT